MKVGILTYHRSINYGAFLQCYSLANSLKKIEGLEVEVIDYDSRKSDIHYKLKLVQKCLQSVSIKPYKQVREFKKVMDKLPISKELLISDSISSFNRFIKKCNYDVIIVGSDEVWKLDGFRGFPNPYWLIGNLKCIKMSYAASSRSNINCLSKDNIEILKLAINDFDYIGVRDRKTYEMIKESNNSQNTNYNCDPTFMLEIHNNSIKCREMLKKRYGISESDKLIGVMSPSNHICNLIKERYGNEYKIISLYNPLKSADYYLGDLNPFEWIDVIKCLEFFVTSFFHGTIFSMKVETPFICIDTYTNSNSSSKIEDLLEKCNLQDRLFFNSELKNSINIEKLYGKIDCIIKEPQLDSIKHAIELEKEKFYVFVEELKTIMKGD